MKSISDPTLILIFQGIIALLYALVAAYFKGQMNLLQVSQKSAIADLKNSLLEKLEDRQTQTDDKFVPLTFCGLMHQQERDRQAEVIRRIEIVENKLDQLLSK